MLRPEAFQQPHVALQNLPYAPAGEGELTDLFAASGVLSRGSVVWTREAFAGTGSPSSTLAFVEELGVITLDPRWLARAEAEPAQESILLQH